MRFASVVATSALVAPSIAGYALQDDYSPENFFSMFNFFTDADPTNGELDPSFDVIVFLISYSRFCRLCRCCDCKQLQLDRHLWWQDLHGC